MSLYHIDHIQLREICRSQIESLELWLRRIINQEFSEKYGGDFINEKNDKSEFIIKKSIRDNINNRYNHSRKDFPRIIDAAFFENLSEIFCHPNYYDTFFKKYLIGMFPESMPNQYTYLSFVLDRLKIIRNNLSHANSISIRDAEFGIFSINEMTGSFKKYYNTIGKNREYDVPQIIKAIDSFGNAMIRKDFDEFEIYDFSKNPNCFLRPNDILSIEIEVDPSYTDAKYQIRFGSTGLEYSYDNKLVYKILDKDVSPKKCFICYVRSDKTWHKHSDDDDRIYIYYKILPPAL
jgi:hypothetical protein